VGRFNSNMFRWGLNNSLDCDFGEQQTAQHSINDCAVFGLLERSVDLTNPKVKHIGLSSWKASYDSWLTRKKMLRLESVLLLVVC